MGDVDRVCLEKNIKGNTSVIEVGVVYYRGVVLRRGFGLRNKASERFFVFCVFRYVRAVEFGVSSLFNEEFRCLRLRFRISLIVWFLFKGFELFFRFIMNELGLKYRV